MPFCQGDAGAIGRSRIPMALMRAVKTCPNANQRKNWLPAPKGGFFQFAARFYGPYGPLIDGSYKMPRVMRVE